MTKTDTREQLIDRAYTANEVRALLLRMWERLDRSGRSVHAGREIAVEYLLREFERER